MPHTPPKLFLIAPLFGAALLFVSCGGTSPTSSSAPAAPAAVPQTADDAHTRWITAIRAGDRATARSLVGDDEHAALAEDAIRTMQDYMAAATSPTGALQDVKLGPATAQGQEQTAVSMWRFAKKTWCYTTRLAGTAEGWAVVGWGQMLRCPAAP